jgi:hypothetical protein
MPWAGRPGFDSRQGKGRYIFLLATATTSTLGPTQTPIQREPGVTQSGQQADHSPSAKL